MTLRDAFAATVLSGLALMGTNARAGAISLEALTRNSPFAPPATANQASPTDSPLEFRGVLVDGGESFFSLYDPAARLSMWVGMNEQGTPFKVQSYDAERGTAVVHYKGRAVNVTLKQSKVAVLVPTAAPAQPPMPVPGAPNAAPQATASAPSGDEASRLAAVADEIRRRRALRAQTTLPNPTPKPPEAK